MDILCPVCKNKLIFKGSFYQCENRHSFDLAKEGYLNLNLKSSQKSGDNPEMIKARKRFLEKGYYDFLKEEINALIQKEDVLLDLACGEGYYTKDFPSSDKIGIDLSKTGLKLASKNDKSTLTQQIRKANVISLSIGSEELFSKLRSSFNQSEINNTNNIKFIDNMFKDLDILLKQIRKLTKKDIFVIGYYNPLRINAENEKYIKSLFNYIDSKFEELEDKYNIKYIEINDEFINQDYKFVPNINNSFPSQEAYYYIFNEMKKES